MSISIIGGDLRMVRLAELYSKEEVVYIYGFEKYFVENQFNKNNIVLCDDLEDCVKKSKTIISGVPITKDNLTVIAPFTRNVIELIELKKYLANKKFIAGNIPEDFYLDGIENVDLLKNEELAILNAIPTVEGTIKIAIEEREETIFESNVLICGYGRIGKILCDRFSVLGANVYCTARKEADLTWIREKRYVPIKYDEIKEYAPRMDLVVNTIPYIVLKKEILDYFKKDVLMIDIASNPGGIDRAYARQRTIKIINAQGIPGREMPMTTAKYIKKIIGKYS